MDDHVFPDGRVRGDDTMTPRLYTRSATPADFAAMYLLWYERAALLMQMDAQTSLAPDAETRWMQHYQRRLHADRAHLIVAVEDEAVIGYALAIWDEDALLVREGQIEIMAIDMHSPHSGAASSLMAGLRAWFAAEGVNHILVRAARRSAVEQAFWRGIGAREWDGLLWLK